MAGPVQFGIAIPQTFPDGPIDLRLIRRILERAEQLELESVWVQEQILGPTPSLEPVELLTYAASLTDRVKLGTAVLLTTLRNPVQLAKSLATLDHLSAGRLIAGVGLGENLPLYPAYGIAPADRVARFVEGLTVMRRLWTEPSVTFAGRFWRLDGATMAPRPVQRPHPPLWFGAHRPAAIERAAVLGDGFIGAGVSTPEAFAAVVERLRSALARAGRDPIRFPIAKRVYIAVDEDERRARERLGHWFGMFYRDAGLADRVAVVGSPATCIEALAALVRHGAGLLILNPVFDEAEQLERLAAEVIPALARA